MSDCNHVNILPFYNILDDDFYDYIILENTFNSAILDNNHPRDLDSLPTFDIFENIDSIFTNDTDKDPDFHLHV